MFYDQVRTFLHFRRSLFFTFPFFLWSFVYENKKQRKINFSETLDRPCTIKEPLGDSWYQVLRNKKVFGRGGCLHPAPVISAFFFFVLFLEFLLQEQIKKQREIKFSESLDMPRYIIKSLQGFYKTLKFCTKVRAFLQLLWFRLFPFSFSFWSFRNENKKQGKFSFSEPLDMPPL